MKAAANNCVKISRIRSIFSPYLTVLNFEVYGLNLQLAKIRENAKQKITLNIEIHAKKLEPSIVNKMLLLLLFYQLKAVSRYCKQSLHSMLLHFSYVGKDKSIISFSKKMHSKKCKMEIFFEANIAMFLYFSELLFARLHQFVHEYQFPLKKKKNERGFIFLTFFFLFPLCCCGVLSFSKLKHLFWNLVYQQYSVQQKESLRKIGKLRRNLFQLTVTSNSQNI